MTSGKSFTLSLLSLLRTYTVRFEDRIILRCPFVGKASLSQFQWQYRDEITWPEPPTSCIDRPCYAEKVVRCLLLSRTERAQSPDESIACSVFVQKKKS